MRFLIFIDKQKPLPETNPDKGVKGLVTLILR